MHPSSQLPEEDDSFSNRVIGDSVRLLATSQLDERLERYRLSQPKLEQQMLKSLRDYGQLSPVVVCQLDGRAYSSMASSVFGLLVPSRATNTFRSITWSRRARSQSSHLQSQSHRLVVQ